MAPRKKAEWEGDEYSEEDYDPLSEEEAPKRKRKPAAAKPKKAAAAAAAAASPGEEGTPAKKAKKPKPPPVPTEPTTGEDGWTLYPPSFIYKADPEAQGGARIAAFDLDGTLVGVKSKARFPIDAEDWRFFNKHVPKHLRELHEQGYQLVIFSNQGGIKGALTGVAATKAKARVDNILEEVRKKGPLPVQVFFATQSDEFRKPNTGMWEFFVRELNRGVQPDLSESFFVGDAAGRPTDINDGAASDKEFAAALGLQFKLPEDAFGEPEIKQQVRLEGSKGFNDAMADAIRAFEKLLRDGGDVWKANTFRTLASTVDGWPSAILAGKELAKVKGIGKSCVAKIDEFLSTGKLAALEEAGIDPASIPKSKSAEVAMKFV